MNIKINEECKNRKQCLWKIRMVLQTGVQLATPVTPLRQSLQISLWCHFKLFPRLLNKAYTVSTQLQSNTKVWLRISAENTSKWYRCRFVFDRYPVRISVGVKSVLRFIVCFQSCHENSGITPWNGPYASKALPAHYTFHFPPHSTLCLRACARAPKHTTL